MSPYETGEPSQPGAQPVLQPVLQPSARPGADVGGGVEVVAEISRVGSGNAHAHRVYDLRVDDRHCGTYETKRGAEQAARDRGATRIVHTTEEQRLKRLRD